jgi:anti-sigma B factor antagonist
MGQALDVRVLSDTRAVLSARGRLNAVTAPAAKAEIMRLVEEGRVELVCDLTDVGVLDSSGLAALVSGLKATRERGGYLKLVAPKEHVAKAFRLTRLDRVFELYPSVEAALAA